MPSKIFTGEPITITGTYTILNTSFYDSDILEQNRFNIYINDELVYTIDTLEFTITPAAGTMRVTVQPTISQTEKSSRIKATTLSDVIITPDNYDEYVYKGALDVDKNTKVMFQGNFTDKGEIVIPVGDILVDGDATFTNTMFTLEASGIIFQNMDITNNQTAYPIVNTADNNVITHNKVTITNTDGKTAAIYNKANNTEISYNDLFVDGPAMTVTYTAGVGVANTQAILLIGGDNNIVQYNNIQVTSTGSSSIYGTVEGITNNNQANNTIISNNNITVSGKAKFNYAINSLGNVENMVIRDNNILVSGERYADGIQVGNNATNILIQGNTIKCICQNTTPVDEEAITYGIITTSMGSGISDNITITENNIDLTGTVNYGMEIYQTTNTLITDNLIKANGLQSMGIGYAHSPNSTVTGNTITTSGDSTQTLKAVTEEIEPANVGIQIQQDSNNILIEANTIQTYDKGAQDTCINVETNNVTIKDNNLTSSTKTGDDTVNPQPGTTLEDNNAIEQESSTNTGEEITLGDTTTLTASFYDDTYTPISTGTAIFKVNGKTLRNDNGEVIYVPVINGRAELPDVNITSEWTK
ncbi:MAG: hypothetical protein BZ136_01790 [Methanosphaera sp. rholeuAM74]|nr:MAG: hypothetical protein BZ136_01790 [Methanosphaera sp. rholeuAM74]